MAQHRPWHLTECPARDVRVKVSKCDCPPERFLSEFAEPVPEAEKPVPVVTQRPQHVTKRT